MDFTVTATQTFPVGQTVEVYPQKAYRGPTSGPIGVASPVASATMGSEGATFSGLEGSAAYAAYANVAGDHRWVTFRTSTATVNTTGGGGSAIDEFGPINVRVDGAVSSIMLGAVADGISDDSLIMKAAVALGTATGRKVYAPAGTYKVTSTLTENTDWYHVYGDGPGRTVILQPSGVQCFKTQGGLSNTRSLAAAPALGTVTLNMAITNDIAEDRLVYVRDTTQLEYADFWDNDVQGVKGQICRVDSISGNTVTLASPTLWPYTTSTSLAVSTTLSGSIDDVQTTGISFASVAGFASRGHVLIGTERIRYTGISGTSLTGVTRGAFGTLKAAHTAGASSAAYTYGAEVNVVTPVENCTVRDLTIKCTDSTLVDSIAISLNRATGALVENVEFVGFPQDMVNMEFTTDSRVTGCWFMNGRNDLGGTPYCVKIGPGCDNIDVDHCFGRYGRHLVTSIGDVDWPAPNNVTVTSCLAVEFTSAAFDTHWGCRNWTFSSCHAIGQTENDGGAIPAHAGTGGFQLRGWDIEINDPIVHNCPIGMNIAGAQRARIKDAKISACTYGLVVRMSDDCSFTRGRIDCDARTVNAIIVDVVNDNLGVGIKRLTLDDIDVHGPTSGTAVQFTTWDDTFKIGDIRVHDATAKMSGRTVRSLASAATVTLPVFRGKVGAFRITGTAAITSIAADQTLMDKMIVLKFAAAATLTDGSNLKLNGNYAPAADDTITLVCDGTNWIEVGRSRPGGAVAGMITPESYGAVGDGVTSDQTAVVAAVAAAFASGRETYWTGTYLTTATIPNFHDVRKRGRGVVKRSTALFPVEPMYTDSNTISVGPAGVATNDGLSVGARTTLDQGLEWLKGYGPVLNGNWTMLCQAGTYTGQYELATRSINRVKIAGAAAGHPNVPTTIVDATGLGFGIRIGVYCYAWVKDMKVIGTLAGDTGSTLLQESMSDVWWQNCHSTPTAAYSGVTAIGPARCRVEGGIYSGGHNFPSRMYGSVNFTFGYQASNLSEGTQFLGGGGSGSLIANNSTGDIFYCTFDGGANSCIYFIEGSRAQLVGCAFKNSPVGVKAEGSHVNVYQVTNLNTFTSVTKELQLTGFSTESTLYDVDFFGEGNVKRDTTAASRTGSTAAGVIKNNLYPVPTWMIGKKVRVSVYGAFAGAGTKTVGVRIGGTVVTELVSVAASTSDFQMHADVFLTAASAQFFSSRLLEEGQVTHADQGTAAATVNNTNQVQVYGTLSDAAGTITVSAVEVFIS